MSAPTVETTMPAQIARDVEEMTVRPAPPRRPERQGTTTPPAPPATAERPAPEDLSRSGLGERLVVAHERAADLEERLAAAERARDAAEHHAAQLEDRNRELASDLDDALDQLAGHALHAEQERLVHVPAWSPWSASSDRGGIHR
ncbi:hypothetical protein [Nocardia brasiliensis]|uniref:hypothetical protein n=1 Tax=Nocardia brasiliensis TaxID=37326 RepID=UPI0024558A86|nr:hypothetical protein [Nocardia brasiliensis]